jgi:hypothetical protein
MLTEAVGSRLDHIEPGTYLPAHAQPRPPSPSRPLPAPGWSVLALDREGRTDDHGRGLVRRIGRLPVFPCVAVVLAILSIGSWAAGVLMVLVTAAMVAFMTRLPSTRRWRARRETWRRNREALELRAQLASQLPEAHRQELVYLESLVEAVRNAGSGAFSSSPLVTRLDGLLLVFVDLALELRRVSAGFSKTAHATPAFGATPLPGEEGEDSEVMRLRRIARLRVRARDKCRARLDLLKNELAGIGQLIRLAHEQSLASRVPDAELARTVADVLDEAEHAWQARVEADAVVCRA